MTSSKLQVDYVAMVNYKGQPILLRNYSNSEDGIGFIQQTLMSSLDIVEMLFKQRQLENIDNQQQQQQFGYQCCFLGIILNFQLNNIYYDISAYITVTKIIILVVTQNDNIENLIQLQNLMDDLYKIYRQDLFQPFNDTDPANLKMSQKFLQNIDKKIYELQDDKNLKNL